jgi:hypothetical protein
MAKFLLEQIIGTSALLNGVAVPGRSIEAALSRHTFNVFVANDDVQYSILLRGSGTAIRFDGHELLLCTQHQLAGADRQKVGMITEGGRTMVTSGGMRYYTPTTDTDRNDLVAFNFDEPVRAYPELKPRFFNLGMQRPLDREVVGVLLIGCATADQLYDVYDNNHIGLARRSVVCKPDPAFPADTATLRVIPRTPLSIDPDGMSGGSAFLVYDGVDGFEVAFGGIIVRGGRDSFTVLKAGIVIDFLESIVTAWRGDL